VNELSNATIQVAGIDVAVVRGGAGKPLLVLHDELGFAGWLQWARELAGGHDLVVPLQPGFGQTPRVEWVSDYRDLASFYLQLIRELDLRPVDILGFSAGGYIAAEMAAASPESVANLVLVAPLGIRPHKGEIFDFLAVTGRSHLEATVARWDAPEASSVYGGYDGQLSPEQFQLFEAARAETSRLGWEPFMFSPSLPHRLGGLRDVRSLIIWGDADRIVPESCITEYQRSIPGARVEVLSGCGHRPEIESASEFVKLVDEFLRSSTKEV
jgi:pimeloyl-ACP methyl ester carboxylesterase